MLNQGRRFLHVASLALLTSLNACGLYTPEKDPFSSNAPIAPYYNTSKQGDYESGLVDHVTCEISRALADTKSQYEDIPWLYDKWGTAVTLTITVEDQTGLSPGISFLQPLHSVVFPFPVGGNVVSPQSFSASVGGSASVNALRTETIQYTIKNQDAINGARCGNRGSGVLIDGDLKIREFIFDKAQIIAGNNGLWTPGKTLPYNAWTDEITFVSAYGATATPTWHLARVSANTSSNLFVAQRTNTNDLILTLGPLEQSKPSSKGHTHSAVEEDEPLALTTAAMNQHNARVAANAIAVSISGQSH